MKIYEIGSESKKKWNRLAIGNSTKVHLFLVVEFSQVGFLEDVKRKKNRTFVWSFLVRAPLLEFWVLYGKPD